MYPQRVIRVENVDGAREALIWSEPPTIYADTWALYLLSRDAVLRTQFMDAFRDRGTLAISLVGVGEIGAYLAPERPELRSFLEDIGPRLVPITNDPFQVMREQRGADIPAACISGNFINDPNFSARLVAGDLSLVHVVDLTRGDAGADLRRASDVQTQELCRIVARRRAEHLGDPQALDRLWPPLPFDAVRSMEPIYNAFVRQLIRGNVPFENNDARDLFHAIASVACRSINSRVSSAYTNARCERRH